MTFEIPPSSREAVVKALRLDSPLPPLGVDCNGRPVIIDDIAPPPIQLKKKKGKKKKKSKKFVNSEFIDLGSFENDLLRSRQKLQELRDCLEQPNSSEDAKSSPSISFESSSAGGGGRIGDRWHPPGGTDYVSGQSPSAFEKLAEQVAKLSQQMQELRDRLSLLDDDGK